MFPKKTRSKYTIRNPEVRDRAYARAFLGYIDRGWLVREFSLSTRAATNLLRHLKLKHKDQQSINIIKDYLEGESVEGLAQKYALTSRNIYLILHEVRDIVGYKRIFSRGFILTKDNKLKVTHEDDDYFSEG